MTRGKRKLSKNKLRDKYSQIYQNLQRKIETMLVIHNLSSNSEEVREVRRQKDEIIKEYLKLTH